MNHKVLSIVGMALGLIGSALTMLANNKAANETIIKTVEANIDKVKLVKKD